MSLTADGYIRQRLAEIKADYDARFIAALGPVNTAPDSVIGETIGIFSAALDDVYEYIQSVYDAMYPSSAEGVSLDGAVSFTGASRLDATATKAIVMCYGSQSTLVPAGALVRSSDGKQYATTADTIISRSATGDVLIAVDDVVEGYTYQVIAAGSAYTYEAQEGDDSGDIVDGIIAAFDAGDGYFSTTNSNGKLRITAADMESQFPLTLGLHLSIDTIGSPAVVVCTETGANAAPAGSLSIIDTATAGWDSVANLTNGSIGRDVESDEDLRARYRDGIRASGASTMQAIRARMIAEVDSVDYCRIYENRTCEIDANSLPSHSFEAVISGGLDVEVAEKLWSLKPAGIQLYGDTEIIVTDENGDGQPVRFSRPTEKYLWVRVSVDSIYAEEPLSASGIASAVLSYAGGLEIGEDVIGQRFVGPIYDATTGIRSMTVEVAVTDGPTDTPTYTTGTVEIGRRNIAVGDATRITVLGV